jgi:hypothetical protein
MGQVDPREFVIGIERPRREAKHDHRPKSPDAMQ